MAAHQYQPQLPQDLVRALNEQGVINPEWYRSTFLNITYNLNPRADGLNKRMAADFDADWRQPIHPCFRKELFRGISPEDYKLITPSLRLATCILDDLRVTPFFNGLLQQPLVEKQIYERTDVLGTVVRIFREKELENDGSVHEVYSSIVGMREHLEWKFDPRKNQNSKGHPFGNTEFGWKMVIVRKTPDDADKDTRSIEMMSEEEDMISEEEDMISEEEEDYQQDGVAFNWIQLHHDYLRVLRGEIKASTILSEQELGEPLDEDAALLRTRIALTFTVVHEFAHAYEYVYSFCAKRPKPNQPPGRPPRDIKVDEPFYGDHRVAEVGEALEQFIFGCTIWPIEGHQWLPVDCAYGLYSKQFPGAKRDDQELRSPTSEELLSDDARKQAVGMESVSKFFTNEFWANSERYSGRKAFEFDRVLTFSTGDTDDEEEETDTDDDEDTDSDD